MNYPAKISALWTVFLLGTLFHTQLALMPLFHGLSVAESHVDAISLDAVMWFMLIFFALPLMAILGCFLTPTKEFCILNFGMTITYSVLNLLHLVLDASVVVPSYQIALMGLSLAVGLLLNFVSYHWVKSMSTLKARPARS